MAIRVTQNMLNSHMLRNLSNSMGSMDKYQEQLSSGRKISRPSDDPVVATRGMFYRSALVENGQFQRNVNEATSWMELADKAMDEQTSIMKRVDELAVYSGNVSLNSDSLKAIAEEIDQIKEQMGNIANQTVGGRYIFAGTDTQNPPYSYEEGNFVSDNNAEIRLEMNKNVFLPINVSGQALFNYPSKDKNVFKLLDTISAQLKEGKDVTGYITDIQQQEDNLNAQRASLGARVNRIELISDRLQNEEVNVNKLMSDNEDADVASVITNLKTQENVHSAALGAGARIIQPSLMDFLR